MERLLKSKKCTMLIRTLITFFILNKKRILKNSKTLQQTIKILNNLKTLKLITLLITTI
jgi:hypothetical protein